MKNFQSKSGKKFSIKIWLQKVKHVYIKLMNSFPSEPIAKVRFFNQGLLEKFQSKSGKKISIKVWLKK